MGNGDRSQKQTASGDDGLKDEEGVRETEVELKQTASGEGGLKDEEGAKVTEVKRRLPPKRTVWTTRRARGRPKPSQSRMPPERAI